MNNSKFAVWLVLLASCLFAWSAVGARVQAAPAKNSVGEAKARKYPPLEDSIERKHITVWSEGTKMAADIYLPKERDADAKFPVIVFVNGTGGTLRKLPTRLAPHFVAKGYAFVAFDYRGWGESDSKLVMLEPMPEPDSNSEITVKVRALRWQMDLADQTADIQSVISYVSGEKNLDRERIGLLGTSYGGALVTWVAGNDPRVKCVAAQVPGMMGGRPPAALQKAYDLAMKQARGETEPVPYMTQRRGDKTFRYHHMRYNLAKNIGYSPIVAAAKIKAPMLIIDAGEEELMDITKNGGAVASIVKKSGTPVKYHIIKGIKHYGVYRDKLQEVLDMEIDWFNQHLMATKLKNKSASAFEVIYQGKAFGFLICDR
jgi:uncharacterized protein